MNEIIILLLLLLLLRLLLLLWSLCNIFVKFLSTFSYSVSH